MNATEQVRRPRPWRYVVGGTLAVVLALVVGAAGSLGTGLSCSGGEEGPSVAPLSDRGQFCQSVAPRAEHAGEHPTSVLGLVLLFAPAALTGAGAVWAAFGRRWLPIWVALGLGLVAAWTPVVISNSLSPTCHSRSGHVYGCDHYQ